MIFIFGALPLFITKVVIEYLWKRFRNSDPNKVNRSRNIERIRINQELTQVETELNQQNARLAAVQERLEGILNEIVQLENQSLEYLNRFNELRGNAERLKEDKNRNLNQIYNAQLANVDAGGPEFLKNALEGRKAAFSQGFYSYITEIYAEQEAARRIGILQSAFDNWSNQNFN
jgi:chromosome segregation ATPase